MVLPAPGPAVPLPGARTAQVSLPSRDAPGAAAKEQMNPLGGRQERSLSFRKSLFSPLISPVHQTGHEREKYRQNIPRAQLTWRAAQGSWVLMEDGGEKPFPPSYEDCRISAGTETAWLGSLDVTWQAWWHRRGWGGHKGVYLRGTGRVCVCHSQARSCREGNHIGTGRGAGPLSVP